MTVTTASAESLHPSFSRPPSLTPSSSRAVSLSEFPPRNKCGLLSGLSARHSEALVSATVVKSSGCQVHIGRIRCSQLVRRHWPDTEHPLTPLHKLGFLEDNSRRDFLLRCEKDMMFVRSDFVRAVVEPDRVLFLGVENATCNAFLQELASEMQNEDYLGGRLFSVWVVECIVCTNVALHTMRLQVMKPVAYNILGNLRLDSVQDSILQLYPVNKALSAFIEQLRPLVDCLLDGGFWDRRYEDNGEGLEKREKREKKSRSSVIGGKPGAGGSLIGKSSRSNRRSKVKESMSGAAADAEADTTPGRRSEQGVEADEDRVALLKAGSLCSYASSSVISELVSENDSQLSRQVSPGIVKVRYSLDNVLDDWTHSVEELLADATELYVKIEDALWFLEASMSCTRNRLLQWQVITLIAMLVIAFGGMIAGIFGMNLVSGLEDRRGLFYWTVFFVAGGGCIIGIFYFKWMSRSRQNQHDLAASTAAVSMAAAQFGNSASDPHLPVFQSDIFT